jgi:hypothetical protein
LNPLRLRTIEQRAKERAKRCGDPPHIDPTSKHPVSICSCSSAVFHGNVN